MSEIIRQKLEEIHERDNWTCQFSGCDKRSSEIAHRISKSKANKRMIKDLIEELGLKLKVDDIINHKFNLVASCKDHNDYFNIGFRPVEVAMLLKRIIDDLVESGDEKI